MWAHYKYVQYQSIKVSIQLNYKYNYKLYNSW